MVHGPNICGTLCVKWRGMWCVNHRSLCTVYSSWGLLVSCHVLLSDIWVMFPFCNPRVMFLYRESFLPVHECSIIYVVFDNRMDSLTPCMTLLSAVAKRNWGGQEKYNPGVVLTVIRHHACAQICYCMPVITTSSGNFKYFATGGPWVMLKSNNKNSFSVKTFVLPDDAYYWTQIWWLKNCDFKISWPEIDHSQT
jgi:hypothetical protein